MDRAEDYPDYIRQSKNIVEELSTNSCSEGERYYLKALLLHVLWADWFAYMTTVGFRAMPSLGKASLHCGFLPYKAKQKHDFKKEY